MSTYNASPNETGHRQTKPARIELVNGETYVVAHHEISEREQYILAYEETRGNGIDYRIPMSSILIIDTSDEDIRDRDRFSRSNGEHKTAMTLAPSPPVFKDEKDDEYEHIDVEALEFDGIETETSENRIDSLWSSDEDEGDEIGSGDPVEAYGEAWTVIRVNDESGIAQLEPVTAGARARCADPRAGDSPTLDVPFEEIDVLESVKRGKA